MPTGSAAAFINWRTKMSTLLPALLWAAGAWQAFSQSSPIYAWTNFVGQPGSYGSANGTGSAARFYNPEGVAVDSAGNLFVADTYNDTIRKVTPDGVVTTLAGSARSSGANDGTGSAARFYYPTCLAVDNAGNLVVADSWNNTIRNVTSSGVVTTLAGDPSRWPDGSADGTGSEAQFYHPRGVAVDSESNVFVGDFGNNTIRKVTAAGVVTTLAGSAGASGTNDHTGSAARFSMPYGVAVDSAGNVFVGDFGNCTIRKVTSAGVVTTLAGCSWAGGTNDGAGSAARFDEPCGVAVDSAGNVFVGDSINGTIRKVTPAGVVTTIGGMAGMNGWVDGIGSAANFAFPLGIAVDSVGNLYVADQGNNRISKGTPIYPWLTVGFGGTHLQVSWPAVYQGWELQAQTNWPGTGLGTNWFPVAGSTTNTQLSIPVDPSSPGVFYRLHNQ
jgi:hypothetical protein